MARDQIQYVTAPKVEITVKNIAVSKRTVLNISITKTQTSF